MAGCYLTACSKSPGRTQVQVGTVSAIDLAVYVYRCDASHAPQVTVTQGVIEGKTVTQPGLVYNSFQGIPYAKPPIGKRRFKVGFTDVIAILVSQSVIIH